VNAIENYMRALDLEAFHNLVDPAEEDYLRTRLSPEVFHTIQRKRMRAALEYVRRTAYNASILLRVGEAARQNANPEIAAAASELIQDALRLRINAKIATLILYGRIVLGARISAGRVIQTYDNLASWDWLILPLNTVKKSQQRVNSRDQLWPDAVPLEAKC
jgi:hypothetical protein